MVQILYLPTSIVVIKEKILLIITETPPKVFLPSLNSFQLHYKVETIKAQDDIVLYKIIVRNRKNTLYDKFIEKLRAKDIRNLPNQPSK